MRIPEFVQFYKDKTDEELIGLTASLGQLTDDARLALEGELSLRGIRVTGASEALRGDSQSRDDFRESTGRLQEAKPQGVGDFLTEVLQTYHSRFWLYFRITAPAVLLSTIAILFSRYEVRELLRNVPRGEIAFNTTKLLGATLLNASGGFLSWLAFSFAFGTICIALEENASGFTPSAWDSFAHVWERMGPFLRLSVFLLAVVLVLETIAAALLWLGGFPLLQRLQMHRSHFLFLTYALGGIALLVASRFSLAVPAVLLDDLNAGRAMLRSAELTRGKWLELGALLAKSLVGGYVAGMGPFWLASFITGSTPFPSWVPWALRGASIIGVSVVEPTMFIGFGLLYLQTSPTPQDFAAPKS